MDFRKSDHANKSPSELISRGTRGHPLFFGDSYRLSNWMGVLKFSSFVFSQLDVVAMTAKMKAAFAQSTRLIAMCADRANVN